MTLRLIWGLLNEGWEKLVMADTIIEGLIRELDWSPFSKACGKNPL